MKKPLVIFSFLPFIYFSFSFSQSQPDEILQPLMDCLNAAVPIEKAKPFPSIRGIKDACVNELQLLAMLPPDVHAAIAADIDSGLAQHLAQ